MWIDLFGYNVTLKTGETIEIVIEAVTRAHADILFGEYVAKNLMGKI